MSTPRDPDALFRAARAELTPTPADEARNLSAVMAKIGALPGGGGGGGGGGGAAAAGKGSSALAVKIGGALFVAGVIVTALVRTNASAPAAGATAIAIASATAANETVAAPAAPPPSAPAVVDVGSLPNAPASESASAGRLAVAAPPLPMAASPQDAPADPLAAELRLVERIHAAENRNELATVFALAAEHERSFPTGVLIEEREASRSAARCKSDPSLAESERVTFARRFPRSTHAARVTAACTPKP